MEKINRYTLGQTERLKSRKAIEQLFREGKSFSLFPFRILYRFIPAEAVNSGSKLQTGFTVSSRHFKKAVHRNRIRRHIKEAYRLQKNELQQLIENNDTRLSLFFIFIAKEIPSYGLVYEKTTLVLQRLKKLAGESKR